MGPESALLASCYCKRSALKNRNFAKGRLVLKVLLLKNYNSEIRSLPGQSSKCRDTTVRCNVVQKEVCQNSILNPLLNIFCNCNGFRSSPAITSKSITFEICKSNAFRSLPSKNF